MGNIILACLLILFFMLCRFVVIRAERYFGELRRNTCRAWIEEGAGLKDLP